MEGFIKFEFTPNDEGVAVSCQTHLERVNMSDKFFALSTMEQALKMSELEFAVYVASREIIKKSKSDKSTSQQTDLSLFEHLLHEIKNKDNTEEDGDSEC